MKRLRHVLNLLVLAIGAVIVRNELRDRATSRPAPPPKERPEAALPTAPAAPSTVGAGATDATGAAAPAPDEPAAPAPPGIAGDADAASAALGGAAEPPAAPAASVGAGTRSNPAPGDDPVSGPPATDAGAAPPAAMPSQSAQAAPSGARSDAVRGDGTPVCPDGYPIKGNAGSMIYHRPGQASYARTLAEWCFASEAAAQAAGYRPPKG